MRNITSRGGDVSVGQWDFCANGQYTERGIKGPDGYGATLRRQPGDVKVTVDLTR
jgi:hypothetical protein